MKYQFFIIFAIATLLSACSSTPLKNFEELNDENIALLVGENTANSISFYLNPLATTYEIGFCKHNDKSLQESIFGGCPEVLEVKPGIHKLEVNCVVWHPLVARGHTQIYDSFNVKAGHIYMFTGNPTTLSCNIEVNDTKANN